ncbi:MAG: phosphatase PAP2 family protein [Chloroflexi bacterium]|nr:phosphatase PAP2 family protein [Chloroflexota bacterium]
MAPAMEAPAGGVMASRTFSWLPHEIVFGAFLAITWLRLGAGLGPVHPFALAFLGCLAGAVVVRFWAQRNPTPLRWRIRLLYYPAAMGFSFFILELAVPALGVPRVDGLLLDWDRALLGETPSVAYMTWDHPWLNEGLMVAYLFFFYYLIMGPAHYCLHDLPRFRQCFAGLFSVYGLSLLTYTLLPAAGPHLFLAFPEPLEGAFVIRWMLAPINSASNGVDVFPSVHFAVSFYLLVFDWRHRRRRFRWFVLPCVMMWFATVLLRFHYLVDLLGGLAVAIIGLTVASWYERRTSAGQRLAPSGGFARTQTTWL